MKYLILGGTGTLGHALTKELLKQSKSSQIVCFSRDELKQKQMKDLFKDDRLSFCLGDIRDRKSLTRAMNDIDTVFHVAAYKHVDLAEENPEECFQTNVVGTVNAADCSVAAMVRNFVFCSTDKAVFPINTYGFTKALSEKILLRKNKIQPWTHFSVFRWGNILGSRGSVLGTFSRSLIEEKKVRITDRKMTRFWLTIDEAAKFMVKNYAKTKPNAVMIPPLKSAPVLNLAICLGSLLGVEEFEIEEVGLRAGEKIHESITETLRSDKSDKYTPQELSSLIRKALSMEQECQS